MEQRHTSFDGLTTVNIELTNRCNKKCWMCGRRQIEPKPNDMDFGDLKRLSKQLPNGIVVQFHNNGEPLLYPVFGEAVSLFKHQIRCMDTNGKLLMDKRDEIINNLDTITISTFENDDESEEQLKILKEFLRFKGNRKPRTIIRCLGHLPKQVEKYKKLDCLIVPRVLHSPMGSFDYQLNSTIPEIGICLDLLNHLSIRSDGYVSMCVRFDPYSIGIIGNLCEQSLSDIWNSELRKEIINKHIVGKRNEVPLCNKCHYWGVPTGGC